MKKLFLIGVLALGLITTAQAANEGIKVHGHWQFDIYNKDGSFDRKVEFENALAFGGNSILTKLLSGSRSTGYWRVVLEGNGSINEMCLGGFAGVCTIIETGSPFTGALGTDKFKNLNISLNSSFNLVLQGSVVISNDNEIRSVKTKLYSCSGAVNPRSCSFADTLEHQFTEKNLSANPVVVQAGQTVNVTVTISFS